MHSLIFKPTNAVTAGNGSSEGLAKDVSTFPELTVYQDHNSTTCIDGVLAETGDVAAIAAAISKNLRGRARVSVSCVDSTGSKGDVPAPANCLSCLAVSRDGVFRVKTEPVVGDGSCTVGEWLSQGTDDQYATRIFKRNVGRTREEILRRLVAESGKAIDGIRQSMIPGDRAFAEAVCLETGLRAGWATDYDRAFPVYYPEEVEEPGKPPVPLRKWLASA